MNAVMDDLRYVEVDADRLTECVNEMFLSVPMNPKREQFFRDYRVMDALSFFSKWFPVNWKVKLNAFVRLSAHRLGIYTLAKRMFLQVYTKRDVRTRRRNVR